MQEVFFMYRVIKVLNNNGILVLDDANGQEQILLGNGVGKNLPCSEQDFTHIMKSA